MRRTGSSITSGPEKGVNINVSFPMLSFEKGYVSLTGLLSTEAES